MDQHTKKIVEDLYEQDPQLLVDQDRLIKIVSKLSKAKPETSLDPRFALALRKKLIQKDNVSSRSFLSIINSNTMKKFNYVIGTAAICAILVVATVYMQSGLPGTPNNVAFDGKLKITNTDAQAFGKLDEVSEVNNASGGMGGGNRSLASNNAAEGVGAADTAKLIAPVPPGGDYPVYKYVYKGETLNLTETQHSVLKRLKGQEVISDTSGLLGSLNFGLANLNSFPNLRVQSVSFTNPDPNGYSIYVDVDNASLSINGAWPQAKMSSSMGMCIEGPCGEYEPVKLSEIPADDEAIRIANQFIADHSISTEAYGEPYINNDWRRYYELATDKSTYYLPDVVSVVYPLMIDGQFVYDESGNRTGLNVAINVRNKQVTSVYELSVQNYQSSMYEGETDVSRIMKVAERGGVYGYDPAQSGGRIVEVELGEPRVEYVKMWNYRNNQSEELLIPSLIFPVMSQPTTQDYFRSSVVVPLVKDILNRNDNPVRILPLEGTTSEPAVAPAVDMPAKKE
jgi:hypothetical protein